MKITANQITFSRILLLPIPCLLVYGGMTSKIIGLFLFAVLGFTDFIDGVLARRYGTTVLGSLMDPMADKIFLAATYIPLGDMDIIPLWVVFAIMAREFAVTSLRSIFLEHKLEFQTSEIAKYKTNVQMGGAAIIFLTYIFKNTGADRYILAAICVAACVAVLVYYAVTRSVGLRAFSVAFMLTIAFTGRMIFSPPRFIQVCFAIVLFFTLVSGIQYALRGWHERPRKSLKLKARHWHLLLFYPVVLSGIFVGTLCYTKLMTWAVILIFALEFAGRGLDNHVTYCGRMLPLPTELVKSALQIVGGLCALGAGYLKFHDSPVVFALSLVFVVILTSTYNILIFYRNRDLLL